MHKNILTEFSCSPKINLQLNLEKTLWVLSYFMLIQLGRSLCWIPLCGAFEEGRMQSPLGRQSCSAGPLSTPPGECGSSPGGECPPGCSQAQFTSAGWQVPLKSADSHSSWRKRQNIQMQTWFVFAWVLQHNKSSVWRAALLTFISVAVGKTVL